MSAYFVCLPIVAGGVDTVREAAGQVVDIKAISDAWHNCDSMMDLTRKHFYKQGERQCMLDMFD